MSLSPAASTSLKKRRLLAADWGIDWFKLGYMQRANYAAKVSVLMPFVSAMVGGVVARGEHASILRCIISVFAGFLIGAFVGALSVGISGLFLTFAGRVGLLRICGH